MDRVQVAYALGGRRSLPRSSRGVNALIQIFNQPAVPKGVEVGTSPECLDLVGVAALVIPVATVERLVNIRHQMHQVLQGGQPTLIRCVGAQHSGLLLNGADNALIVWAIPLPVEGTGIPGKVDVMLGGRGWVAMLIGPGRDGRQGLSRLQRQQAVNLTSGRDA
jgi:hypothetical protein